MAHTVSAREQAHYERQVDALLEKVHEQVQRIQALEITADVCLMREEAIARVIALHVPNDHGLCEECLKDHPCSTFQALLPR